MDGLTLLLLVAMWEIPKDVSAGSWERMASITPRGYVSYFTTEPPQIDGRVDDRAWQNVPWTDLFVDIEGDLQPNPRFETRAAILWDDAYLYVAARMVEPHVWGSLTEKNSVIFQDNDFEIFIDPDGDHHNYYEFEVNPLNTIWELTMEKPYRDGGPAISPTNIEGLISAVHVEGTLNDPRDVDAAWSVEIAIPWTGLARYSPRSVPPKD
ncbi:MAG: carbohydrate-binding family 9-like protein, partial [Rhodothermales bacterium]